MNRMNACVYRMNYGFAFTRCLVNAGWTPGERRRVNAGWTPGERRMNAGWTPGERLYVRRKISKIQWKLGCQKLKKFWPVLNSSVLEEEGDSLLLILLDSGCFYLLLAGASGSSFSSGYWLPSLLSYLVKLLLLRWSKRLQQKILLVISWLWK